MLDEIIYQKTFLTAWLTQALFSSADAPLCVNPDCTASSSTVTVSIWGVWTFELYCKCVLQSHVERKRISNHPAVVALSGVISCFLMTLNLQKSHLIGLLIHTKRGESVCTPMNTVFPFSLCHCCIYPAAIIPFMQSILFTSLFIAYTKNYLLSMQFYTFILILWCFFIQRWCFVPLFNIFKYGEEEKFSLECFHCREEKLLTHHWATKTPWSIRASFCSGSRGVGTCPSTNRVKGPEELWELAKMHKRISSRT